MSEPDRGFLARWSQRKAIARREGPAALPTEPPPAASRPELRPPPPTPAPAAPLANEQTRIATHRAEPGEPHEAPPTLGDVAQLTPASDFTRFVAQDVSPDVKNAALRKLFSDPHFNVMDGLDIYIDDYGKPDPLPLATIRQMAQAEMLGLFARPRPGADSADAAGMPPPVPATPAAPALSTAPHEDPDLRLQPHDAPRCDGDQPRPGVDTGREP